MTRTGKLDTGTARIEGGRKPLIFAEYRKYKPHFRRKTTLTTPQTPGQFTASSSQSQRMQ